MQKIHGVSRWVALPLLASSLLVAVPPAGALVPAEKGSETMVEELKRKVQEAGWQVLSVPGEGEEAGFLFTVGLVQTYGHPEILLFAPGPDPRGFGGQLQRVVERIRAGERFQPGQGYEGLFNQHPGRFREIDHRWLPEFLGTAGVFYYTFDFPALQLFWPDREGRFPWQGEFSSGLFHWQPILSEPNLVLANLPDSTLSWLEEEGGLGPFEAAVEELLVDVAAPPAELLESWRWLIGDQAELLGTTVFGDVILREPGGALGLLGTGRGVYIELSASREDLLRTMARRPEAFLHAPLLLELRALGYELAPGEVYDFRQEPILGGLENVANVQKVPARVRLSNSGRVAMAARGLPTGARVEDVRFTPLDPEGQEPSDDAIYEVVINAEEQYSIWPAGRAIPAGWKSAGKTGTREQCLAYIAEVWTDMRPLSLREKMNAEAPE